LKYPHTTIYLIELLTLMLILTNPETHFSGPVGLGIASHVFLTFLCPAPLAVLLTTMSRKRGSPCRWTIFLGIATTLTVLLITCIESNRTTGSIVATALLCELLHYAALLSRKA
jgi:hypothetical protein